MACVSFLHANRLSGYCGCLWRVFAGGQATSARGHPPGLSGVLPPQKQRPGHLGPYGKLLKQRSSVQPVWLKLEGTYNMRCRNCALLDARTCVVSRASERYCVPTMNGEVLRNSSKPTTAHARLSAEWSHISVARELHTYRAPAAVLPPHHNTLFNI